jgi:hypothetical protein
MISVSLPLARMTAPISPSRGRGATLGLAIVLAMQGCHRARPVSTAAPPELTRPRVVPLARSLVLETSGPPPSDTSVSFVSGEQHTIVLRHGPPENIVFARLSFTAAAFADSGQTVTVEVHPRPGLYGLDFTTSTPLQPSGATLAFEYPRFFSAPSRATQVYGSDIAYERALAIGRLVPDNQLELLPSSRPAADNLSAAVPGPGRYLAAAPQ